MRCPPAAAPGLAAFRALLLALALMSLWGCAVGSVLTNCTGDCVNGQGTMSGLGGWSYAGQFQNGEAQGKGTFIGMDSTRFEGLFEGGRRVGPGVLTRRNGQVVRGIWNDMKPVGYQTPEEFSAAPPVLEGYGPAPQAQAQPCLL